MIDINTKTSKQVFQKILVNGQEIHSFDDLPPEVREKIDKDGNGQIDALEKLGENKWFQKLVMTGLEMNGKKIASWDEVPKDFQSLKQFAEQFNTSKQTMEAMPEQIESINPENKPTQISNPIEVMWK